MPFSNHLFSALIDGVISAMRKQYVGKWYLKAQKDKLLNN
jgi:hypothetical protein